MEQQVSTPPSLALRELMNLAAQFQIQGKMSEAGEVCSRIVHATQNTMDPIERAMRGDAMNFLAALAADKGQLGTAIDFFREAINCTQTARDGTLYRINLTRTLLKAGWREWARNEVERALRMSPPELKPDVHRLRGLVAREEGDGALALKHHRIARDLTPNDEGAILEYAGILADTAQLEESKAIYQQIADTSTDRRAEGIHGVGLCLMRQMRCAEAVKYFDEALEVKPDLHMARWNRALTRLTLGDFGGWDDHEARFLIGSQMAGVSTPMHRFNRPVWDGKPASETGAKSVHFHAEQGLGDSLQFCRFALTARDMGHDVRLEVGHELVPLLSYSLPGITVTPQADDWPGGWGLAPFDCHAPMMSLPFILDLQIEDIPGKSYLKAESQKVAEWAVRLKDMPHPRVGICWHGRSRAALWVHELDVRRSLSFAHVKLFMRNFPEMKFVSLQVEPDEEYSDPQLLRFDDDLESFADTAALIANLDLVISVDTAAMHCAAGLGKRTWLLDRFDHCWRWHEPCGDKKTLWYPSATIYRQKTQGDWTPVLEQVARDLEGLSC